jgi:hypothetical protein
VALATDTFLKNSLADMTSEKNIQTIIELIKASCVIVVSRLKN